ncbi:MAG: rod shape-determining protein MreC [Opitutales bacterium]|nr:rod shape-determining protein MreC [Opitutales bacterium]MBP3358314.1 rod shape-determining protein MreC [Opitutales bacterium]MBQ2721749.1 rod shape-determining protein MreC [Opitutales bacterium]MBR7105707.1 rod shape-determining protein MreC [Opitutales bacterium]
MQWRRLTYIRNLVILVVAIFASLFAPSFVRNGIKDCFREFQAPIDSLSSQFNDLATFWGLSSNTKRDLIEAGRDLARLNAGYQGKVIENESLRSELGRLEKMLYLPSYDKFKHEVARVCRRDINAWWQHLTIRKGKMHGIRKGYAVVYAGGVVGRISEVGLYTSTVELVSSRNFRMATCAEGDDRPLIYQGAGSLSLQTAQGEVSDVPADMSASTTHPITLVTSSLAGTFPDGIYVGKILSLKSEPDGIFKSGYVKLPKGLASIKEVSVLVPIADAKIR